MELIKQVTSLEISKKLKELGVKQESLFYWSSYCMKFKKETHELVPEDEINPSFMEDYISAFTTSELGEMLPELIDDDEDRMRHHLYFYNRMEAHFVAYRYEDPYGTWSTTYVEQANTEADARGKMLVCLFENKLLPDKHHTQ